MVGEVLPNKMECIIGLDVLAKRVQNKPVKLLLSLIFWPEVGALLYRLLSVLH